MTENLSGLLDFAVSEDHLFDILFDCPNNDKYKALSISCMDYTSFKIAGKSYIIIKFAERHDRITASLAQDLENREVLNKLFIYNKDGSVASSKEFKSTLVSLTDIHKNSASNVETISYIFEVHSEKDTTDV